MLSSMIEKNSRISFLKNDVQSSILGICTERAVIWTKYHKNPRNRKKSPYIQMAEALKAVLLNKTIKIYPNELIVGNLSSKRIGGSIFPELHGLPMMLDIFKFSKRKTNPLQISHSEILQLLKIVPFWLFRFLGFRTYNSSLFKKIKLLVSQLRGHFYLINEAGGISHVAPDYEKLVNVGTDGIIIEVKKYQNKTKDDSEKWYFYESIKIIAKALADFGERYSDLADQMIDTEHDHKRRQDLQKIAKTCKRVPRRGASNFHEAVQSLFFAQIALNLETIDEGICPGRMDQYLYPFYKKDIENGLITREEAKELLAAFSIKMSEIIPVFSEHLTKFHGGMFNGQVVTVGGMDSSGKDSANELSYIFLEIMDELRMRQPNYHARIHSGSSEDYIDKINNVLISGSNSPALYNDDIIIETMCKHGYDIKDARNYIGVGCVEPACQGKSFSSTDAALFNIPLVLEMALNEGKRFGSMVRSGAETIPVSQMKSMDYVKTAFEQQLTFQINRLISDLQEVEIANRKFHPTPLISMLIEGCIKSGTCSTAGGAAYNFSGIQCVGPVDTGDALYALEKIVFTYKKISLPKLVELLKRNINEPEWLAYLKAIEKFGNDNEDVDKWIIYVVDKFVQALENLKKSTRGGRYVAGIYSVTSHEFFGTITGAFPNGRRKGEGFSSGISPANGMDKYGPTALINSVNRLDFTKIANGINLNLKLDSNTLRGKAGREAFKNILKTYFRRGGMQVQINVVDPKVLLEARDNPELHPYLTVRISGYSAYFNDLTPEMKDEIIRRSTISFN